MAGLAFYRINNWHGVGFCDGIKHEVMKNEEKNKQQTPAGKDKDQTMKQGGAQQQAGKPEANNMQDNDDETRVPKMSGAGSSETTVDKNEYGEGVVSGNSVDAKRNEKEIVEEDDAELDADESSEESEEDEDKV